MFLDSARIFIHAGKGGAGCVSFRREKYVPRGGPDGGDGGRGGHVVLLARAQERTLNAFRFKRLFKAPKGRPGQGSRKTGASGKNLIITVPIGTVVIREDTEEVVADLVEAGQKAIVARGGSGGRGNTRFKSSTNQAPHEAEPGGEAEEGWFQLELKLLADVGLVGLPNAGKSTLLSVVSKARPKVASYPFTTLTPHLGVVSISRHRAFVMADIPGLIEGAHMGVGLGDQFLKHVERTRILLHLVDLADPISPPVERFEVVEKELREYGAGLSEKPVIVVGTKADLTLDDDQETALRDLIRDRGLRYYRISAVSHKGLEPLLRAVWARVAPEEE